MSRESLNSTQALLRRRRSSCGFEPVPLSKLPDAPDDPFEEDDMRTEGVCGIGYEIRHILNIDCVQQEWKGLFVVYVKWYSKQHLSATLHTPGIIDKAKVSPPEVIIWNSLETEIHDETVSRLEDDPPGVLMLETLYYATMSEFMELEMFPLDVQDLTLIIRFKDPEWTVRNLTEPHLRVIAPSVEVAEWYLYEPMVSIKRDKTSQRATWKLQLKVFRKSDYYMSNVIMMVCGITSLSFLAWLFSPHQWEQRSTFSATLLLTLVAFKFVLAGELPKVPFMTLLDIYLIVALGVMCTVILESGVVYLLFKLDLWETETALRRVDLACCMWLFFSWAIWNIGYYIRFLSLEGKQRNRSDLGSLLSYISTNSPSKGAMNSLYTGQVDEDEDGAGSDADAESSNRTAKHAASNGDTMRNNSKDDGT